MNFTEIEKLLCREKCQKINPMPLELFFLFVTEVDFCTNDIFNFGGNTYLEGAVL